MMPLNPFRGEEHQPFQLKGSDECAALLVHGFPGTPAEMRPLGDAVHEAGWSAHGLLLPGFGAQIETLPDRRWLEWLEAVAQQTSELKRSYRVVVVIGFSMGGAVCVNSTLRSAPHGLVLLNPLSRMEQPLWRLLPLLKRAFPRVKPFSLIRLNFQDPETRKGIRQFMPDADLDDPAVQQAIRQFELPTGMLDELRQVGEKAFQQASMIPSPALVIQGSRDTTVSPAATRKMAAHLPRHARYIEIDAEHHFIKPEQPGWSQAVRLVLDFMEGVRRGEFHQHVATLSRT